ncbi:hypothetical protein LEP1GSC034_0910 [Leptospira interrogans str. 2003000735]|uniref:Uncharacterized protein n=8 Tax=Leptospira interrogans TaxID=173 RepID=A0AAP9WBN8_LEPIR|nr:MULTISPECIES: hypothetical protein [Leptospira]EMM93103.1 hypothetical protein LEP1GSC158_2867 [Leptospira interrogans serovar Zanoni str. LT2156]EMN30460.1 hypothetical protein LEP1GSC083_2605 [Leptospira interrogans serovar Pyrogenes str. L0374]EMY03897.1 hypothetical protein LEP1GSC029_3802 [Leptospira interrogans str. 2002000626]EMY26719.1 hypothetical protein LEP1GSC115_4499 [Leptospira interrogans serovar Australis str. 200703203]AKH77100.1 hypothetical protein BRAT_08565 [Leptospira 
MAKDWKGFDPKNPTASDLIPFAGVIYFFLHLWSFFPFFGIIPALIVIPFNKNKFLKYLPLVTNFFVSIVYLLYK